MSEKTHEPTAKRLRDARQKGDLPRAPLLPAALGLLVTFALLLGAGRVVMADLAAMLRRLPTLTSSASGSVAIDAWQLASTVLSATAPFCLVLAGAAVLAGVVTGGVSFSPSRLSPDPSRLNAFGGLKNLTGKDKLWGAARGLLVAAIAGWAAWPSLFHASLPTSASASTSAGLLSLGELAARILRSVGAIALGFAAVDVIVGRQTWLGRLRMSRDEVMREHKEGEGDPEIKHRREELHHELMAGEAVSAVRDATVLVVNPTHLACALRYDGSGDDDVAPTLTGKGAGAIAARMIEAARIYGVPIVRDVPVARALYDLEVGTEIPELLYEAVAEVLRSAWEESAGAEANAEP